MKRWGKGPRHPTRPYTIHLRELEFQVAELLDRGDEPVAGLEPNLLVLRITRDHAFGRAGEDEVARLEREVARRVGDELFAVEHHVGGVRRLPYLAVHAAFNLQIIAVNQIGGDEPRPDRCGAVKAFAEYPLARAR